MAARPQREEQGDLFNFCINSAKTVTRTVTAAQRGDGRGWSSQLDSNRDPESIQEAERTVITDVNINRPGPVRLIVNLNHDSDGGSGVTSRDCCIEWY